MTMTLDDPADALALSVWVDDGGLVRDDAEGDDRDQAGDSGATLTPWRHSHNVKSGA